MGPRTESFGCNPRPARCERGWLGDGGGRSVIRAACLLGTLLLALVLGMLPARAVADPLGSRPREPALAPGPSLVALDGRRLMVRRRATDGSLAETAEPFVIRGVVWSPASRETPTTKDAPDNVEVRRREFSRWQERDIPLLAGMHVNTVRHLMDPGVGPEQGPAGLRLLDALHARGIMVVMNVDEGVNDLARVEQAVTWYKDHPAVLMWMLGSEWNINLHFGASGSVLEAAQRTEQAARLIKRLDPHHPVATSYGEIHIEDQGRRLADTRHYLESICPSVDVWALNLYRGPTFGSLFEQWASITDKPMLIGEFGTDAYRSTSTAPNPPGAVDEAMQASWNLGLWREIADHLSARRADGVALGGTVFAWSDEWWKVAPPGSQQSSGFEHFLGHPDHFANEEYFGLVDIDRNPRAAYRALGDAFRALAESLETPP